MDLFKAFTEWMDTRLRHPFLSYFFIAFVLLNWKAYALLIWSEQSFDKRLEQFNAENGIWNLLVWPAALGLILSMAMPLISLIIAFVGQWPSFEHQKLKEEHATDLKLYRLDNDLKIVEKQREVELAKENLLAEIAARQQETVDSVGEEVKDQLKDLRKNISYSESFGGSEAQRTLFPLVKLDRLEEELLKFFVKHDSPIPASEDFVSLLIQAKNSNFSKLFPVNRRREESARAKVEVDHAIQNLLEANLLEMVERYGGAEYQVTKAGYVYYDQKLADY